ncbi:hypothetical protein ACFSO0_12285 [Brevibacillus sp. GCM10020057]|uniref:hypothetical protein n=1 Tax=Brevibacillus sp. GCM10020057 TaxID=3317327 RepID=UPI00363BDEB9
MKKTWVQTVQSAERAFFTIVLSAKKRVRNRGRILPERFRSIAKIRRFLQASMTPCLANRVIGNLDLRRINGKLAVPIGDTIGAAPVVKSQVLYRCGPNVTLAVWFGFDTSDQFFRVYQLRQRPNGSWIVVGRHPLDYPFSLPGQERTPLAGCCAPCKGSIRKTFLKRK